jgi:hypothetical protein
VITLSPANVKEPQRSLFLRKYLAMADDKADIDEVTRLCYTRRTDFMDSGRNPAHLCCGGLRDEDTDVVSWLLQESGTARRVRTEGVTPEGAVAQKLAIVYPYSTGRKSRMEYPDWCSAR